MFSYKLYKWGVAGGVKLIYKKVKATFVCSVGRPKTTRKTTENFFMGASLTASFDKYISLWRIVSHRDILATVRHRVFLLTGTP